MKYHVLLAHDHRLNAWVYGYDDESGHHLFPAYERYRCANCGRLDAKFSPDMLTEPVHDMPGDRDFLLADDGPTIISDRAKTSIEAAEVQGAVFWHLPGRSSLYILDSSFIAPTDEAASGLQINSPYGPPAYSRSGEKAATADQRCPICQRYFDVRPWPVLSSMKIPEGQRVIFKPSIPSEEHWGRPTVLIISHAVHQVLKQKKLRGYVTTPLG